MKYLTLTLTLCAAATAACADDDPGLTFAAGSTQYGATMAEWGERWWTWVLETPAATNPVLGGPCATGQSGDVFFLAGNFGGVESRSCAVPAGKALFFPITTILCYPLPEDPAEACSTPASLAQLTLCATETFDDPTVPLTMAVTVDGELVADLEGYRTTTGQFSWTAPSGDAADWLIDPVGPIPANACGIPVGDRFGVADGYWLMLRPLAPGSHNLRFASTVGTGADAFTIDMTYQLTQQ